MQRKNQSEAGFTLLEIALVILIAGILIAAVLSSRGISEAARSLQLQKQVQELRVAVEMYVDKVDLFPGNQPGNDPEGDLYERDLLAEDLISAERRATRHSFGDPQSVLFRVNHPAANSPFDVDYTIFYYDRVPTTWARALDLAIDDGLANNGSIQAVAAGDNATAINANYNVADDEVNVFVRY